MLGEREKGIAIEHIWTPGQKAATVIFFLFGLFLVGTGIAMKIGSSLDDLLLSAISTISHSPLHSDWPRNLHATGIEAAIVGVLLVVCALFVIPRWKTLMLLTERKHTLFIAAAAGIILLWLPVVLFGRSTSIAGQRYWWVSDDAFISMRYARNFANGLGLVWNQGERVEGYSNFLWTLYMSVLHLFRISAAKISLIVLLTDIALAIATLASLFRFVRKLGGRTMVAVASLASFVFNNDSLQYACFGLETSLLTFGVITCLCCILEDAQRSQPRIVTYLLAGTLTLVRADAFVFSALFYALAIFLCADNRRQAFFYTGISLLIPAAHEIFRIYYYGDLLPNTAYLKALYWPGKYKAGMLYTTHFLIRYSFPLAIAFLGAILVRNRVRISLLIVLAIYIGYVVSIGGDAFEHFRFFVPVIPVIISLALLNIQDFKPSQVKNWMRTGLLIVCLTTVPLLTPGYAVTLLYPFPGDPGNVKIGLFLKNNTLESVKVADFWAGATAYFSERYSIDLLGKSDRHIARMPAVKGANLPGHNKFDFAYSLGVLKPDFVAAMFKLPVKPEEMQKLSTGPLPFTGQLYFDPVFQQHCFSHPVTTDTWRTIFACKW